MSGAFDQLSGAAGQRRAGTNAQILANRNAEVAEAQAKATRIASNFEQIQQAKESERIKSTLAAELGAAGGTGTKVGQELTASQAKELELESLLIGFEGETKAGSLEQQAELDRLSGVLAKQNAKSAARGANVQFGLQLASLGVAGAGAFGGGGSTVPSRSLLRKSINV
jgi:hypothetical protein